MTLDASRCSNGHINYPVHPSCPKCGEPIEERIDLSGEVGEVVTWTVSTSTPPGVRTPNALAIVEFSIDGKAVRAIGQLTDDAIEIGDTVRPVHVDTLRDPDADILREPASQPWDGYRFSPTEGTGG